MLYSALVGFANNMIAQVGMSCNFGEVGNFVEYLIGPDSGFPMEVFSFIGMVAPMITQFRLPECVETPGKGPDKTRPATAEFGLTGLKYIEFDMKG